MVCCLVSKCSARSGRRAPCSRSPLHVDHPSARGSGRIPGGASARRASQPDAQIGFGAAPWSEGERAKAQAGVAVSFRVCPGTSCGIAKPSQHEADRGKAEEGERLAVEVLPILSQPTAAVQPSYGAFDNPALRENDKPFRLIRALHDFKVHAPQDLFDRTSELRSLVSAIGVELQQKRIAREEHGHQPNAPVAILDMGGVHDRVHQQALRIDEKVTLLALDPFTRIIARRVDRGPPFSALFTLWLSMIATVGLASRAACSRHFTESVS